MSGILFVILWWHGHKMGTVLPQRFYRYQKLDTRQLSSLIRDNLYFSFPSDFNDPFDCKPSIFRGGKEADLADLERTLITLIQNRCSAEAASSLTKLRFKEESRERLSEKFASIEAQKTVGHIDYMSTDPELYCSPSVYKRHELLSEIETEILRQHTKGVCCFSSSYDSELMWSHYADSHHGICVGYSLERRFPPEIHSVLYGRPRILHQQVIVDAVLHGKKEAISELQEAALLAKSPKWKYEKEWRLISNPGLQRSPLKMTDITFGLRCDAALIHAVMKSIDRPDLSFFQMFELAGRYSLKRAKLSRGDDEYYDLPVVSGHDDYVFDPIDSSVKLPEG
ncbi:hypothetical protein HNQ50_000800 [Silvimonas terrae]|uniref:DUF2971 domain-containing protein n=1 Tax=Silvimonas terrae TaxID=300266 RepID=A0A840RCK6_9NEIS|nr:DUF2971 domain-containing protein [Silvimonas terrae]MBB5190090.1 hypothetical protein [Silvimonas terrae]